ncbi:hypothetical protein FGO68_gene10752 [Halteria grandinella]|uniref:MORN repeat protein n=1 Tax=Halteria grandinella TaxID=5974 RepID=A0A8J8NVB4_HALGN|nr:hypothetical protein FGO68_gene10752 [Halteria grandinella]
MRDGYGMLYCTGKLTGNPYLYECEWVKGTPTKGSRVWINKDNKWENFEGQFDEEYLATGTGRAYRQDAAYEGEWKDNNPHGYGRITFPNGQYQEGQHLNAKLVGVHKLFNKEGKLIKLKTYEDDKKIKEEWVNEKTG